MTKALSTTALEFIKQGWTQGALARDTLGVAVGITCDDAVCWCSIGAIGAAYKNGNEYCSAFKKLEEVVGTTSIDLWNDKPDRTKEDVIEAFVKAGI